MQGEAATTHPDQLHWHRMENIREGIELSPRRHLHCSTQHGRMHNLGRSNYYLVCTCVAQLFAVGLPLKLTRMHNMSVILFSEATRQIV